MKPPLNVPPETAELQARASDPGNSVWVSANAGSGKTHVLAQRVIRLLLDGTPPAKILCLTYTRAAAANMANRVFADLADWTLLDDATLARRLAAIDGRRPSAARLARARRLYATALETPGGLKIQTIHAFCEAVLQQFPLEANIAGHFELLDSAMEAALVAQARRDMVTGVAGGGDQALAEAFATVLTHGGEYGLDLLLGEIVAKRDRLRAFLDQTAIAEAPFADLFDEFGFLPHESADTIAGGVWPDRYFDRPLCLALLAKAQATAKGSAVEFARGMLEACEIDDPELRLHKLRDTFLTKKSGEGWQPRSLAKVAVKTPESHFPGFSAAFAATAEAVRAAADRLALFGMLQGTCAALTVGDWLIRRYEELKSARGFLDFNDLITRTVRLLSRQDAGQWVHYKLDRGIDHILIDEAQDTSPAQWQVVKDLAAEFFAGAGAGEERRRTLFAVGDEKQSIYSFQGADPASFAESGDAFAGRVRAAGQPFERLRLTWSFRSTEDVLSAVDRVFARPHLRQGLGRDRDPIEHRPIRAGAPGYVEIWPSLGAETVEEPDDWRQPIDHARAPSVQLAERIAATIAAWIGRGERLEATGKPVLAGNILVLVRKRDRFVHALSRSLKARGIPVAGADRLSLPAHIAVKDMAALGRFLLQPHDDLSLAAVLKSPVFGETEERLYELAAGRAEGTSLYAALRGKAVGDLWFAAAAERLAGWMTEAAFRPPFEFYAGVLHRDGVRAAMIARLGQDAGDILDEFLSFSLAEERVGLPGLEAFLAVLDTAAPEIKREMDQGRDEVRIMTVHAAKGLEAPVVFLVDGGAAPFAEQHLPRLIPFASRSGLWQGEGFLWRAAGSFSNSVAKQVAQAERQRAEEEYRRLLYVGMTRAEDRLIICGYHGKRTPPDAAWHAAVSRALTEGETCRLIIHPVTGQEVHRYQVASGAAPAEPLPAEPSPPAVRAGRERLPAWLRDRADEPAPLPRPLSPSRAAAVIEDGEAAAAQRSPVFDALRPSLAIRRGLATHRLLQMLPEVAPADRAAAAERYLALIAEADWSEADRAETLAAVDAILEDAAFQPLFAPGSRAEVAVMGRLEVRGRERVVSGKLDRLAVTPDKVLIVDYKTNRPAPAVLDEVPAAYVGQMALYRALLQPLYPQHRVEAALLFTEAPRLLALPGACLDAALARLVAA